MPSIPIIYGNRLLRDALPSAEDWLIITTAPILAEIKQQFAGSNSHGSPLRWMKPRWQHRGRIADPTRHIFRYQNLHELFKYLINR
ncbi:hypothetical protein JXJ21_15350 [candidate division KSB1 bacterium]|nr:hypothetical protein [candidate division KSB1 bacterium]